MKMPDKIKKGLECCNTYNDCQNCPYDDKVDKGWGCCIQRNADALAYIQQLEEELATTKDMESGLSIMLTSAQSAAEMYKRERDAAVADMERMQGLICQCCKEYYQPDPNIRKWTCRVYGDDWATISEDGVLCCGKFKWRGLQEE